jgi:DeoR/GlpR family transcriptional regulator of sugar metabolism
MAEILPKLLYIGNLQDGNAYVTSSTSGSYAIIKSINICNTGTATETFSINIIPPGSVRSAANSIMGNITLTAGNVFSYDTSIVVPAGHAISLQQPTNNLTFAISGVDYVV